MSSPSRTIQFDDYYFGEHVDVSDTEPPVPPILTAPPLYRRQSSNSLLSPLQSLISQQQQQNSYYVQPLTRDMLEKKDRLDLLLRNRPTPGVRRIQRRRSISNGNIYRRLYNEDNMPMTLASPFEKMQSENSDASVNSPDSQYNNKPFQTTLKYSQRHSSSHHGRQHHKHYHRSRQHSSTRVSSSVGKSLFDSNRDRSYGSITNKKQSTNSRSVNTSHASSRSYSQKEPSISGPPRRFSGLVRMSAAHIALGRTRRNKKRHYQSRMYLLFHKLAAIASRVVNSRSSEPSETKMSIDEMTSLSRYLYVLKHGFSNGGEIESDSEDDTSDTKNEESKSPRETPVIGLFVDESSNQDQEANSDTENTPLLSSPSPPRPRKRHLSSLGNIFPFAPIDRIPSISRSGSESSQVFESNIPAADTDHLLPPSRPIRSSTYTLAESIKHRVQRVAEKAARYARHQFHTTFTFQQHDNHEEHNTQIRFEGWSLFLFSPTSSARLFLWKIVGTRGFEVFILLLLISQWILMSFVPVLFNDDTTLFKSNGEILLLIIYIIYTFELVSKIIVYGFALNTHSISRPNLGSWIRHIKNHQRRPSFFSVLHDNDIESVLTQDHQQEDDTVSNYTRTHHQSDLLPSFAHTACSVSSAASIKSNSDRRRQHNSHSGSSNPSDPPSPSSFGAAASGSSPLLWRSSANSSSYQDDLESVYNSTNIPVPKYRTRIDRAESEDAQSILSEAEHQVLASLNPYIHHPSEDSNIDFLKVTHRSYLSNVPNILDFVSVISYWIDIATILYLGRRPIPIFQALSATRLLRLLVVTEGTTVIMKSLSSSYDMLRNVMGFFIFFWLLFSLAALFIFMNAFSRRCAVWPGDGLLVKNMTDIQYVEPRISCSGYMTSATTRTGPFDVNIGVQLTHPGGDGVFCQLGQVCIQDVANQPAYGYMSYENILYTMLNILTVISTENWTDLLYITQDSVSNLGAAMFYSFCIYLMTFIMVPMFIAVITTSFAHIRGDMRESAFSSKRKAKLLLTSGKRQHKSSQKQEHASNGVDDEDQEEWIYEGTGLGGHLQNRSWIHGWAYYITHHAWFHYAGSILVVLNVVAMMFYSAHMSSKDKLFYDFVSRIFTFTFAFEILLRIYGCMHWRQFWRRIRNRIDLVIVIATVIGEIPLVKDSDYSIYLVAFNVCRSYRISYLFPGVLQLLSEVIGDGQGIANLTFFTFLVLLLLSPMSVQLFGGDFTFVESDEPSMRFDNSYQAFLALFQIMTGENWTDILYDAMHSQEKASVSYAAIYMIFLYFSVHYMVLNLFIAVIMENFDLDEEEIKQIQIKKYIREHQWKPEYFKMDTISRLLLPLFIIQDEKKLNFKNIPQNLVAHVTNNKFKDFISQGSSGSVTPEIPRQNRVRFSLADPDDMHYIERRPSSVYSHKSDSNEHRRESTFSQYSSHSIRLETQPSAFIDQDEEPLVKYGDEYELNVARENKAVIVENLNVFRSIIVLKKDNALRKICTHLASLESYNWFIVGLICISTLLALWADESNREKHTDIIYGFIGPLHALLLLIYWLDIFVHMVADGVCMLPKSYMRNGWNLLDMINLTCQVVLTVLSVTDRDLPENMAVYASYLRILRTLRSIRIVYYVQGMRVIFLDLVYGLPKMIDAVALNILVFVPFAIYGCYLFSGRFNICNDDDAGSRQECFGEFQATDDDNFGILLPRTWKNPYDYSYDTFGKSLLHLFECASGEGWILSLFSAMSVTPNDRDAQPQFSWSTSSIFNSLYYVVFMFVASLCSIQLFIGVFLEIFKQRSGISSMTNTQRQFQDLQRQLALVKPSRKTERPKDGTLRALCYDLVIDKRGKFAQFMATVLTANIIVFATEHLHQPEWLTHLQGILNAICLSLYVFEMAAKIAGLGLYKWASARWNIYDFVLVGLALITSIPKFFGDLPFGWDVSRKLCLVGIAFRLAQRNESLDTLFRSVKRALPSIFFVSSVFFIVIVCFGVAFQERFSSTKYGPYGNEHANFRSLFNTILTLFRITTGENWDFLMHDFTVVPPECIGRDDCGSPEYALLLFNTFYVVCTFIFVNLFTVIVIDNFSFTFDKRNQFTLITRTDLRNFKKAWSLLDPRATGYIDLADVPQFLNQLNGVLAVRVYEKEHSLDTLLEASNHIDNVMSHLIAVPLSDANAAKNPANQNGMNERFFNLYELNKKLSNIDPQVIKERKQQYAEVYQEIINISSSHRIAFHQMLEILAIRLVDISKSLTFDELVNRARIQDKIGKQLATERAKGLVNMVIQRRSYLRTRQKARNSQVLSNSGKNLSIVGNWLMPGSKRSSPSRERSNPFLQIHSPHSKSSVNGAENSDTRLSSSHSNLSSSVPRIVVDQARQQSMDSLKQMETNLQSKQISLKLPDRFATSDSDSNHSMPLRRNSTCITPVTLGMPVSRRMTEAFIPTAPALSQELSLSPPRIYSRRTTALSVRRMSLTASILAGEETAFTEKLPEVTVLSDTDDDVFTQYFAVDMTMDDMTKADAKKILHKFEHSSWSDLLSNTNQSSDNEEEE